MHMIYFCFNFCFDVSDIYWILLIDHLVVMLEIKYILYICNLLIMLAIYDMRHVFYIYYLFFIDLQKENIANNIIYASYIFIVQSLLCIYFWDLFVCAIFMVSYKFLRPRVSRIFLYLRFMAIYKYSLHFYARG